MPFFKQPSDPFGEKEQDADAHGVRQKVGPQKALPKEQMPKGGGAQVDQPLPPQKLGKLDEEGGGKGNDRRKHRRFSDKKDAPTAIHYHCP